MKRKDYLIVALVPLFLLLIPLVGNMTVEGWNWTWHDFLFAWVVFATTTFIYRFIATRAVANLTYRLGAGLAVAAGFFIFWMTAAVQIIGDENPGNILYLGVIVTGLTGVGLARFKPAGMAKAAFVTAAATFLVPVIAFLFWPADFSPGVGQVFVLNFCFVLMFVGAGLLFRQSSLMRTQPAQHA
ncbi:MAG: hypothetical protein KA257_01150 [Opitutaceae bacterium]|nr:hypothetical protein [Opitutaceae bacterium]MBP9912127.1 hypothetical protein [Opitutaceae bacterium]